jgi:uncharacterized membrane protein
LKGDLVLWAAVALATAVEMTEALTIVLAVGVTRGWRATMAGVGSALVGLAVIAAVLGSAIGDIPLNALRVVIGVLLLLFGMQWLRKAILRSSGYVALRDEGRAFAEGQAAARDAPRDDAFDGYSFTVAFKGVFLEGMEVVFIVLTFGASQHRITMGALVALGTALVVALVGVLIHRPLSLVPENTLKFGVGVLLTTFGTFWSTEGAGVRWPGSDASLLLLLLVFLSASLLFVAVLKNLRRRETLSEKTT